MSDLNKRMRPLLGTYVEIGSNCNRQDFDTAASEAFSVIEKVQNLLSFHAVNSDLTKLNSSVQQDIVLDPMSMVALRLARYMTFQTQGLFNFTVGGILVSQKILPAHAIQHDLFQSGEAQDLFLQGNRARLKKPLLLTLDGIAKGYAVDLAVKKMRQCGLKSGWVNAGGDLSIFGDIRLPIYRRELSGEVKLLGEFDNISMATSTNAEKIDERFPGKMVSANASPRKVGIWTVAAPKAWLADALTKVASALNSDECDVVLNRYSARLLKYQGE